ncbi:MAG: hypothetical protein S0880_24150 [Actinomycetota bacterium]|nr:hypothetical protein [Actinomycetota bacterium]
MKLRWFGGSKQIDVPEVERSAFHVAFTPLLGRTDRAREVVEARRFLARGGRAATPNVPQPDPTTRSSVQVDLTTSTPRATPARRSAWSRPSDDD